MVLLHTGIILQILEKTLLSDDLAMVFQDEQSFPIQSRLSSELDHI